MFDLVRKNKRIAQVVLAIIIVPFAFFGMDAYFSDGPGGQEVARVGDYRINTVEFDRALRERQDRVRQASGGQVDAALFNTREFRAAVLEGLINERAIALYVEDNRINVPPGQLQGMIAGEASFQVDGQFSRERYEQFLASQGMTPQMFEYGLAQDLRTDQVVLGVGRSAFAGRAAVKGLVDLQLEERVISELSFPRERFEADVTIPGEEVEAFYRENAEAFMRPPRLKAEYVVLDAEAVGREINIDAGRLREFYEGNADRFGVPEERRASHILIRVPDAASESEAAAAEKKIGEIAAELRNNPERFAEIAERESQDPGSASRGGDLGFFGPGAMVPEFEEVVFAAEAGSISEPVRTDFGFHLIRVTEIKPSSVRPFDEVRDEIAEQLREQEIARRMPVLAEQFANTVYEQPDSLVPAAEALGLEVRTTDWMTRGDAELGGYDDPRLIEALFNPETRENAENIEAIEVERGVMVSARVVEYEAAAQLPYEEVRDALRNRLRADEGARIALAEGEKALATLREGGQVSGKWSDSYAERRGAPSLPAQAARAVFSVNPDNLPAFVGAQLPDGGYVVFRVESAGKLEIPDNAPEVRTLARQYDDLVAEQEFGAFVRALREQYGVQINEAQLDPQQGS